ncbi:hypothetical protein AA313_de0204799 [Arthrobotrys entomopaga]|nr:hypothetical protein AA313_de0204799 [Arthrobotrys entomopaga]
MVDADEEQGSPELAKVLQKLSHQESNNGVYENSTGTAITPIQPWTPIRITNSDMEFSSLPQEEHVRQFLERTVFLMNNLLIGEDDAEQLVQFFGVQGIRTLLKSIFDAEPDASEFLADRFLEFACRREEYELVSFLLDCEVLSKDDMVQQILLEGDNKSLELVIHRNYIEYYDSALDTVVTSFISKIADQGPLGKSKVFYVI